MKKILITPVLFLLMKNSQGQIKEGKILYERTVQINVMANNPVFKNMAPKTQKQQYELIFGNNISLWQKIGDSDSGWLSSDGETRFTVMLPEVELVTYHDLISLQRLEQKELAGKYYLIYDSITRLHWKLTDETKTILTYPCYKASAQTINKIVKLTEKSGKQTREEVLDTVTLTAWFTYALPAFFGPANYQGQLPGTILELDINGRETHIRALEIFTKNNIAGLQIPKRGKRVTPEEYKKEKDRLGEGASQNSGRILKSKVNN